MSQQSYLAALDKLTAKNEFSLDAILTEYKRENESIRRSATGLEERSRTIVMDAIAGTIESLNARSALKAENAAVNAEIPAKAPAAKFTLRDDEVTVEGFSDFKAGEYSSIEDIIGGEEEPDEPVWDEFGIRPVDEKEVQEQLRVRNDWVESEVPSGGNAVPQPPPGGKRSAADTESEPSEPAGDEEYEDGEDDFVEGYDEDGDYADGGYPRLSEEEKRDLERPFNTGGGFTRVLITMLALLVRLKEKRGQTPSGKDAGKDIRDVWASEEPHKKASKRYSSMAKSLWFRMKAAAFLTLLAVYVTIGFETALPLPYAFSSSIALTSIMLLLIEFAVILACLDIFYDGLCSIRKAKPGIEALCVLSCLLTGLDAALTASGVTDTGLPPLCAVSSLALTCAVWGKSMECGGKAKSLQVSSAGPAPMVVTYVPDMPDSNPAVIKTQAGAEPPGFVTTLEEADLSRSAYYLAVPILAACAPILALFATVLRGRGGEFLHALSAIVAAGCALTPFLAFGFPYALAARRLASEGAALAGYAGASQIAKASRLVATDSDIFPAGTISIESMSPMDGVYTHILVSMTGSLLIASGSALGPLFKDLIKKNGYTQYDVPDYVCHEGGGLEAEIRGERVLVGTAGFLNLRGVRIAKGQGEKDMFFTAVGGVLAGVFKIGYTPIRSVRSALQELIKSDCVYFASRDFNITPLLLGNMFSLPSEELTFAPAGERYEASAKAPRENDPPLAVLKKPGLPQFAQILFVAQRLTRRTMIGVALSVAASVLGAALMFFLYRSGASDAATATNTIIFLLLWLIPVLLLR